jgi:hypothetical protein
MECEDTNMKINVVRDPSGNVIATFENATGGSASAQPVLPSGHKVEALEVPENYRANLSAVYAAKAGK